MGIIHDCDSNPFSFVDAQGHHMLTLQVWKYLPLPTFGMTLGFSKDQSCELTPLLQIRPFEWFLKVVSASSCLIGAINKINYNNCPEGFDKNLSRNGASDLSGVILDHC